MCAYVKESERVVVRSEKANIHTYLVDIS
jgi:hypothetical protein